MTGDRTPTGDTPTRGVKVIPGEVPEGIVPPSTSMATPKSRIVVWESDICAGVITDRSCDDCEDDDCEHECHQDEQPGDLRARLTAALNADPHLTSAEVVDTVMRVLAEQPGDLRERLAEALYRWTMDQAAGGPARLLTREETVLWENSLARATAVLPVVEAETAALRERAEIAEQDAKSAWQNAGDWNEIANAARLGRQQAEDAIARVRNAMAYKTRLAGPDAERVVRVADLESALDRVAGSTWQARAEQAERQVAEEHRIADDRRTELLEERDQALHDLAEAERQRDEALDLLRDFVHEAPCDPHPGSGYCQTHSQRPPCPHAEARRVLAALDQPEESPPDRNQLPTERHSSPQFSDKNRASNKSPDALQ